MIASAQSDTTITVRILNGRTGKPLKGIRMYVSFDDKPYEINEILSKDGTLSFSERDRKIMKLSPVGTISCGEQKPGQPDPVYQLSEIVAKGYVSRNDCGHHYVEPHPGELVLFRKYATQWELFKN
jgi:hypothetical protein